MKQQDGKTVVQAIEQVAYEMFQNNCDYKEILQTMTNKLGKGSIPFLPAYLDKTLSFPEKLSPFCTEVDWWGLQQQIVVDLLFQFGEDALETLLHIALKKYDWYWTYQSRALDNLCLMACDGIHTEKILQKICGHMDEYCYQVLLNVLGSLTKFENQPIVIKAMNHCFKKFSQNLCHKNIEDVIYILTCMAKCSKEAAKSHVDCLNTFVLQKTTECEYGGAIDEYQLICAAYLSYQLDSENIQIRDKLKEWSDAYNDPSISESIKKLLSK